MFCNFIIASKDCDPAIAVSAERLQIFHEHDLQLNVTKMDHHLNGYKRFFVRQGKKSVKVNSKYKKKHKGGNNLRVVVTNRFISTGISQSLCTLKFFNLL